MVTELSISILQQLKRHLLQLQSQEYAQRLAIFNGSSIGGHTRHVIEFYDSLLQGMEVGEVNYDARQRDMQIEENLGYALATIDKIISKLLNFNDLDKCVKLSAKIGTMVSPAITTSFEREAIYLIEHSIHHFALIRIGLQTNFTKVNIEPEFGVAFSTIEFRKDKSLQPINQRSCVS